MGELDLHEMTWLRAHDHELLGLPEDEAVEIVRAAGFKPTVFSPKPGSTAFAGVGGEGKILLISVDGRIRLAKPA